MSDLKDAHRQLEEASTPKAALRKQEVLSQALMRVLPDRVFRVSRDGQVDFGVNAMPQPISGLEWEGVRSLNEMTCKTFVGLIKKYMALALDRGEVQCFEYQDADDMGVHFLDVRVIKENEDAVVVIVRDISARKQVEQQVIQLERQQAFAQLALGVSHNLNNILTGILGPAQLIEKKIKDERVIQTANIIIHSAMRATELIKRLSLSVQTNNNKLYCVELRDVIVDVVGRIKNMCHGDSKIYERPISITTELDTDLPIWGTVEGVGMILESLLTNAVDALPNGGHISVRTRQVSSQVELCVEDDGQGIHADILKRIFEPFFTTKREIGSGLGLTLAQNLVTCWQGEITVSSYPRKGTCFKVLLPIYQKDHIEKVG